LFVIGIVATFAAWRLPSLLAGAGQHWETTADRSTAWRTLKTIPLSTWLEFRAGFAIVGIALIIFSALALWFLRRNHPHIALIAIAAAMVPIGFSMLDGVARIAPYFSLANAARVIDARIAPNDKVIYEGPMHVGSSLLFYLGRKFYLVNQDPASEPSAAPVAKADVFVDEPAVLDAWAGDDGIYLLIERNRLPHWETELREKGLPVEQLGICGTSVLLGNTR
jgi:hypothetical protein